jgi:hypothetical protein
MCLKWHTNSYTVHYIWSKPYGPWSKLVHYIGNTVPFGMHPSLTLVFLQVGSESEWSVWCDETGPNPMRLIGPLLMDREENVHILNSGQSTKWPLSGGSQLPNGLIKEVVQGKGESWPCHLPRLSLLFLPRLRETDMESPRGLCWSQCRILALV